MEFTLFGRQYYVSKILAASAVVIAIIISGLLGFFLKDFYHPLEEPAVEKNTALIEAAKAVDPIETPKEEAQEIKVYVTGCVNKPGVVTIKKGQVIDDAIKMAGGATKDADIENINLAYKLDENVMLRIKSKSANKSSQNEDSVSSPNKAAAAGGTAGLKTTQQSPQAGSSKPGDGETASGAEIITDSLNAVVGEADKPEGAKNSLVNINKASMSELESLPNVGPATAKAIIDYREKNGGFKKITDIMNITGIKQKTFDKIKDSICIE